MSSLKSRFVLKCWSFYNSCKARMNGDKFSRAVKIILTVLVAFVGAFLVFLGVVTQEEYDPVGFFTFMSFFLLPVPLLLGMVWLKKCARQPSGYWPGTWPCSL